jgi:hypothetical protein
VGSTQSTILRAVLKVIFAFLYIANCVNTARSSSSRWRPAFVAATIHEKRDLRWAIGDLAFLTDGCGIDKVPRASLDNRARMPWLLEKKRT